MSNLNSARLDYLDAVRSFALLLGIVFHASLSFMPVFIGWAVMDISTSGLVSLFALISHSFRMELFFLIAGFFSHMKFHQQGIRDFLKSRWIRIGIPFLLGWLILRPLLVSGWVIGGQSMRGDANVFEGIKEGFSSLLNIPQDLLTGTHLWFLYYLLFISLSIASISYIVGLNQAMKTKLTQVADKWLTVICQSPLVTLILALPTACCLWYMQHWSVDTPDKSLIPNVPVTLLYGGFFLFGWLLHRQSDALNTLVKLSIFRVILCLLAATSTLLLSPYEGMPTNANYPLYKAAYMFSYAVLMWSLVVLSIGLCKKLFCKANKGVRYIADASYWLYLIHLPIVIWLQIAFAELAMHWSLKLFSICILTVGVSLLIYDLCIRSTIVGKILNGRSKPRYLFTLKKQAD